MKRATEKIIEDAEIAACYFRSLVGKGVPPDAAVQLTASYVSTLLIAEKSGQPPREPWQDGDGGRAGS